MLSSFVFLIYFVCINVSFIVIQYIHAEKSEHTLDPGATGPADMKTDGIKEMGLSEGPEKWQMSSSRGTSETTDELTVCVQWQVPALGQLSPPVSVNGVARWRPERARRSPCCPQDVMGAFVVLIQPPPSVATLTTNAVSQQMLVGCFFFA